MDWSDSADQAAFRAKVRNFMHERLPSRYKARFASYSRHEIPSPVETLVMPGASWDTDRMSDDPEVRKQCQDWVEALNEQGWVAAHWPSELGGAGLSTIEQYILNEERTVADAPRVGGTGAMFLGSLLMVHGTPEQRARHMPAIAAGKINWAQGYSEPGAGSDLGSLALRAVRDGDEYVLNGQKIWSTPQTADAMYALVRTDPDAPKHRGISFLMIEDFRIPGISWRPLMNACFDHSSFGETFFEDARVAATSLIGEEHRGWYVAMTLMDFDRASISNTAEQRLDMQELISFVKGEGRDLVRIAERPPLRGEIADRMIEIEVGYNLSLRLAWMQSSGLIPNYEASMGKMFSTELLQRVARSATKTFGLYANLWPGDERAPLAGKHTYQYVRTIPRTISGGSSEIQRNVIATRGLGLPRG